jgi:hypothetical protein
MAALTYSKEDRPYLWESRTALSLEIEASKQQSAKKSKLNKNFLYKYSLRYSLIILPDFFHEPLLIKRIVNFLSFRRIKNLNNHNRTPYIKAWI